MGAHNGQVLKSDHIQLNNWVEAVEDPSNNLFYNSNPYRKRLLVNKNTKQLIEQYELQFLSQEDFNSYYREIQQRMDDSSLKKLQVLSCQNNSLLKSCPYIYKVKYFTNTSVDQLCSTIYTGLLYIDKVDLRMKQINDIPFKDQLYLYHSCLQGFKVLYQKVGFFNITEEMVFFTKEGKVKVWMNPNLSKQQPNYQPQISTNINYTIFEVQGSQSEMIKGLIRLIEQNTDSYEEDSPQHFIEYLMEKGQFQRLSFYKAIEQFHKYIEENRFSFNNYIKSIYQLFNQDQAATNNLSKSQHTHNNQSTQPKRQRQYESMKNSSHNQMSFRKLQNNQYSPILPVRLQRLTPLNSSKASRKSYNSDYESRKFQSYNKFSNIRKSNTHFVEPIFPPPANIFSQITPNIRQHFNPISQQQKPYAHRKIITFCPPQQKNSESDYQITKYKSLQKTSTVPSNSVRPITFSYQNQNNIPKDSRLLNKNITSTKGTLINQEEILTKQRKQSIIDKLNGHTTEHFSGKDQEYLIFKQTNGTQSITQKSFNNSKVPPLSTKNQMRPNKINYFSTSQSFILDNQIAEDMIKYLGFNPNSL